MTMNGLNIVLIGLPGSGKSTVGRRLAKRLRLRFVDTDDVVEHRVGKSIADIFAQDGEAAFRDVETTCVLAASQQRGVVIATGGGVVLREDNMCALAVHGLIVFLDRKPAEIVQTASLADRPLVQNDMRRLWALHQARLSLYQQYAMYSVCGCRCARQAMLRIRKAYHAYQRKVCCF